MKKAIASLIVVAAAVAVSAGQARQRARPAAEGKADLASQISYQQPKPDGMKSCACNELERRLTGLRALVALRGSDTFSKRFSEKSAKLGKVEAEMKAGIGAGKSSLNRAEQKPYPEQEDICGQGAGKLESAWAEWQPFLADNGLDRDYFTGVKASNRGIPDEGDLQPNPQGRVCEKGQFWTADRAMWAINGREGICTQHQFKLHEILAGEKGSPGHRCFDYKFK